MALINYVLLDLVKSVSYCIGHNIDNDVNVTGNRCQRFCGTITRTLVRKCKKYSSLKLYTVLAISVLSCGFECWILTKE